MAIRVPCTSTPLHSAAYGGPSSSRCYGFASSMSQTLSAAGGWSCFILVRSTQFLELYCPLQIHAQCGVDIHVCMISLHSFLLSKPLGVWLSLTLFFEFYRRHLWSVASPIWALMVGRFCQPQMWVSRILPISQLVVVRFCCHRQVTSLPCMQE